jgi:VanZ family protein
MNTGMTVSARWRLIFWSCVIIVLVLSLIPPAPYLPTTGWDKSNHLLAFAVLSSLGCRAYPKHILSVMVGLPLYGGLIEVLQSFMPYHLAEWGDLIADGLGVVIGFGLTVFARKIGLINHSD